jgi:hypothetical protein
MKEENSKLLADSHNISNRLKNYIVLMMIEMHTIELLVPEANPKHEVIHCVLRSTILLILFGIRKKCYGSRRNSYYTYL